MSLTTQFFFNPYPFREQFPALHQKIDGRPVLFLDGPGGTQVPERVIKAMNGYWLKGSSNQGGPFLTSQQTDETVAAARQAIQTLYNARSPEEIVFGQNMTSLTFALSRALARTWQPGDEIIVTRLDHDANISPWLMAAEDSGVTVRWLDFRPEDCTLRLDQLPDLLNERTRLVAFTLASNAVGTITDVAPIVRLAHQVGALVYLDAVHYTPHGLVDVQAWDCDFLVSSVYKYFGPHTGALYGKYEHLDRLTAYKVRPSSNQPPGKWETGTQSFESLAGVAAAVDYLGSLGKPEKNPRQRIIRAMERIKQYETEISERFIKGAASIPGLRLYGITDIECLEQRTPTFALTLEGYTPAELAVRLGEQGIFVWDGHYYAIAVMERLGVLEQGGLLRIGFVHYNTMDEVDRVLTALYTLAQK
ncbi:MAG: cysteine desulfurase-like protein [Anaerolineae bacterium]|nr:cysteine desulfurase-like protein [Anaerolineae bacterium]